MAFAVVAVVLAIGASSAFALRAYVFHEGIVGLAPKGATPSTPTRGEVVVSFMFGHDLEDAGRFMLTVYADGRMIWERDGAISRTDGEYANPTGFLEQRLTPEGVELVRSQVIATGLVNRDLHFLTGPWLYGEGLYFGSLTVRTGVHFAHLTWGDMNHPQHVPRVIVTQEQARALVRLDARLEDPASWLPASAWEDREVKAYVPSGYSVCIEGKRGIPLSRVLAVLPRRAENLLRHEENTPQHYTNLAGTFHYWCSRLSNDEARALERLLDRAGMRGLKDVYGLIYGVGDPATFTATDFSLTFNPLFPDQE